MELNQKIISRMSENGFSCSSEQAEKLSIYLNFLIEYNKKVNLTAIVHEDEIITKHFVDSLAALKFLKEGSRHVDVGSGAGFPAIVLKIFCPSLDVTMVESNGKKVIFLEELIKKLGITNIRALKTRAEDLARSSFRASYDSVSARAVTELNKLVEYTIPLIKVGGWLFAYKGRSEEELFRAQNAINKLSSKVIENRIYELEGQARSLIIIEKTKETNDEYPRQNKKIISNPL